MSDADPIVVEDNSIPPGADLRRDVAMIEEMVRDEVVHGGEAKGQYMYWMMVFNNPQGELNGEGLGKVLAEHEGIQAEQVVWQLEKGKEGTLHAQVWVKTKAKHRLTAMKNYVRARRLGGWVMPCRDTAAARRYCEKEESRLEGPWYYGTTANSKVVKKGQRTDLDSVAKIITDGGSVHDVIQQAPGMFVKYSAGLMKLESMMNRRRTWKTEMHILWGVTGSGKSWTAREEAGVDAYYLPVPKKGQPVWWDGYSGQEHVVIEDFYGEIDLQVLLKLADEYMMKVPVKGSMVDFVAKKIWITSNSEWPLWYAAEFMKVAEWKNAFKRRITSCREFDRTYTGNAMLPPPDDDEEIDLTGWQPSIMLNDERLEPIAEEEADTSLVRFDSLVNGQRLAELSVAERDFLSDIDPSQRVQALTWLRDQ